MGEALDREKWEEVSEIAHKMAAPSKYIHADNLYEKLKALEYAPQRRPGDLISVSDLFAEVKEETGEVIESLKMFIQEWKF